MRTSRLVRAMMRSRTWTNAGRWVSILLLLLAGLFHVAVDSISECGTECPDCTAFAPCEGDEHHCEPGENPSRRASAGTDQLALASFEVVSVFVLDVFASPVTCAPCAKPPWRSASAPWIQRVGLRLYA